jgi:hypothetical protein
MPVKEVLAIISVGLMLSSRFTYLSSILSGKTKPHAFSWFIWFVISLIGFTAQVVEGAGPGAWARGVGCASCLVFAVLAWFRGEQNITQGDKITLAAALAAIPLWALTKTPIWSVILVCCIDTAGYLPTARKSWRKPDEERIRSYLISSMGSFFSVLAVENYNPSTWLYPTVLVVTNAAMGCYLFIRRKSVTSRRSSVRLQ